MIFTSFEILLMLFFTTIVFWRAYRMNKIIKSEINKGDLKSFKELWNQKIKSDLKQFWIHRNQIKVIMKNEIKNLFIKNKR